MAKMVYMSELHADLKDGSDKEFSLDIASKGSFEVAKRAALRRVAKVESFESVSAVRCANLFQFDGKTVKLFQMRFNCDTFGKWWDISHCIATSDIFAVKALNASRGVNFG